MHVPEDIVESWNRQHDELRVRLSQQMTGFAIIGKTHAVHLLSEQINRMEVARRVFNTFAETEKVEVPE